MGKGRGTAPLCFGELRKLERLANQGRLAALDKKTTLEKPDTFHRNVKKTAIVAIGYKTGAEMA